MSTVRLYWKSRVTKKRKAEVVRGIKKIYDEVKAEPDCVRLKSPRNDTKYIWIFMFSKAFRDLE